MPLYVYECQNFVCQVSGEKVEILVNDKDKGYLCEVCGAPMVKLITAANAHYNEPGFYTTDYKQKERKNK